MKTMIRKAAIPVLLFALVLAVQAEGEKERMLERLPQIVALKDAGIMGEKADGFIGLVKPSPEHKTLVEAENKDRSAVYEAIAGKQGVSAAVVARRRALQLAQQAERGHWLQDANGRWIQKQEEKQ